MSLRDREETVREEVREQWESLLADNDGDLDPDCTFADNCMRDRLFEIADGNVPVYTGEVIELAAADIGLATDTPELGPAYGEASPVNIITANIFERLYAAAAEAWQEIKDDYEPPDTDDD